MGLKIRKAFKSISGAVSKAGSQTSAMYKDLAASYSKQVQEFQQGDAFGSSQYGRYAANITGATTFSRAAGRSVDAVENGERPDFHGYVDDTKKMRPTRGGSMARQQVETDEQVKVQEQVDAVNQEYARQKALQAKFDAGQVAARIRRGRRADQPGTKGGTIKTSGLGSTGGQTTFAQLLGL